MKDKFNEETLERKEIYNGAIIDVCVDSVELPNGKTAKRELVFHNGAVGILAITPMNRIVLVRQYRKAIEKSILEIPAGKIEKNETDPLETAKRELEEETYYQCDRMEQVADFVTSPGFCNERMVLFQAHGLKRVANPLPRDEDEFLDIVELSLEEAKEHIRLGDICDAKTLYAILLWKFQMK